MPNICDETFGENSYGLEAINCFRKKVPKVAGHKAFNFIKKRLQHSCFQAKFDFVFKISNINNLFEDFPAMSLMQNKSLITCNSPNDKLI